MTVTADEVRLHEFDAGKAEQLKRIENRNKIIDRVLVGVAVIGWAAIQTGNVDLLLATPVWLLAVSWWYLDEDGKVVGLRRRFQELGLELDTSTRNLGPRLFGWEFPGTGGSQLWRRLSRLGVYLAIFVAPGVVALTVWASTSLTTAGMPLLVGWAAGVLVMAMLVIGFISNAVARVDRHSRPASAD